MKKTVFTIMAAALLCSAFGKPAAKDASVISSASRIENGVKVDWAESGTVEVKMFTARGQVVKSIPRLTITAGSSTSLVMDEAAAGVYYVTINTGRSIQKISLIK